MLPDATSLTLFIAASLVLLVIPGPAVLFIVARSVGQGRTAGLVSTLGIHVGTLVHIAAASLGVSALIASSALAFNVLRYFGAAYLIFLGIRALLAKQAAVEGNAVPSQSLKRIFADGILVNVLNPKTALFFLAFLPQFVDAERGNVAGQIALLGAMFAVMGTISDAVYAVLAGSLGDWFKKRGGLLRAQRYFTGSVFVGLGVLTALSGSKSK